MATTEIAKMSLAEITSEADEIRPKLLKAFEEAGDTLDMSKVSALGEGDDRFKSTQLAEMNLRHEKLAVRATELRLSEESRKRLEAEAEERNKPIGKVPAATDKPEGKSGEYVDFATAAVKAAERWIEPAIGQKTGPIFEVDLDLKAFLEREVKTVMSTGAGFAPQAIRSGVVVPAAFQMPSVIDLIPLERTTQNAYVFMSQTTRTNAAAEILESVQGTLQSLAESAFVYTEVSETIRKIGHFVPVTDEQLEDIPGIEDLLRQDMLLGVRERLSSQILNGDGSAPNIEGFYDAGRTGVNQHDATGQNLAVAISNGIEDCAVTGFAQADGVVLHPTDWFVWQRITTADGVFINGHPSESGPRTMWALPVVTTTETAQGQALVGAFQRYSKLVVKRGVEVSISSEHASFFIQGVKAIKAEMRATLAVLREAAFTEINNL